MSNSQLLVFYREQRHIPIFAYECIWKDTGCFEVHHSVRKYSVKSLKQPHDNTCKI